MIQNQQKTIDEVLYQILHHKSYRDHFLAARFHEMSVSNEIITDLETIDKEQLCSSANRIARNLLYGNHQGGHGLSSVFPETLEAWVLQTRRDKLDLVFEFLESDFFENYRELPFSGEGACVEEAFYEFMENKYWNEGSLLEGLVRNEFLLSLFKTLSKVDRPSFQINSKYVKQNTKCCYSVQVYRGRLKGETIQEEPHFVLYATSRNQFFCGEVTPLIADILYDEKVSPIEKMSEILKRHQVSDRAFLDTCKQLEQMGIVSLKRV